MKIMANFVLADPQGSDKSWEAIRTVTKVGIFPYCQFRCDRGSDKSRVRSAKDWSEEELAKEQLLLRFKDAPSAEEFRVAFDEAKRGCGVLRFLSASKKKFRL